MPSSGFWVATESYFVLLAMIIAGQVVEYRVITRVLARVECVTR